MSCRLPAMPSSPPSSLADLVGKKRSVMTEPAEQCWSEGDNPLEPPLPAMPFEQPHPLRPAPVLKALAQDGPIHRVLTRMGDQAWLVTGYEEIRSLYSVNVLGRSHPRPDRAARLTASALFGGRPR